MQLSVRIIEPIGEDAIGEEEKTEGTASPTKFVGRDPDTMNLANKFKTVARLNEANGEP